MTATYDAYYAATSARAAAHAAVYDAANLAYYAAANLAALAADVAHFARDTAIYAKAYDEEE